MNTLLEEFTLSLKIGTQELKLNINITDSKDVIFEKFKRIFPQCTKKKEETLSKLKEDLVAKIKLNSVKPNLRQTIEHYLKLTFKEEIKVEEDCHHQNIKQTKKHNSCQTTRSMSKAQSPIKNEQLNKQIKPTHNNIEIHKRNNEFQEKHQKKKQGSINSKQNKRGKSIKYDLKRQQLIQDVVKAYQTIMQKSNQPDIKQMAKKYLQELGRLPVSQIKNQIIICAPPAKKPTQLSLINAEITQNNSSKQTQRNTIHKQNVQKSPIQLINTITNRKLTDQLLILNRSHIEPGNYQYISKEFTMRNLKTNRYSYLIPDNGIKQTEQLSYNQSLIGIVGRSPRRSRSNQRKYNYLSILN